LGRTGTGKTALLLEIKNRSEHCVLLDLNNISIRYLEHSNIINLFSSLGVKLDLFYKMLWRHILTVEILKLRYKLNSDGAISKFIDTVYNKFKKNPAREKAIQYFKEWGEKFWVETDEHIKEIVEKFTEQAGSTLKAKFPNLDISADAIDSYSSEVKTGLKKIAKSVVDTIQMQKLNEVLDLLEEYSFNDEQKHYYILIDKLDEDWAETETRCRFIRALIEETKSMRRLTKVKIITALRRDLLDLVFSKTRDATFQSEKFEDYFIQLQWTEQELQFLLERRINEVTCPHKKVPNLIRG
jgi:hypothetical protein